MNRSRADRNSLARAAIVSLVLHLLAVPFFTVAGATRESEFATNGGAADETSRTTVLTLDRRATRAPAKAAARATVAIATHAPPQPVVRRTASRASHVRTRPAERAASPRATERAVDGAETHLARASSRTTHASLSLTLQTAPPERTAVASLGVATPPPALPTPTELAKLATPTPAAATLATATPLAATPSPVAVAREGELPPGGWGQSFSKPLVADEATLAALRAKYRGLQPIAIEVDASGRATRVAIPESIAADTRAELARILSAARYVPAECNGLRCTGTLQLVL